MNRNQQIRLALASAFSLGFLYLAFRNVKVADLGAALLRVDPRWLAVAVVLSLLLMVLRAWRWQLELRPLEHVPLARLWPITAVAYMCIQFIPLRLGEVVRPWLLSRRSGVSLPKAVGSIVVEKTMDSVVLLFYMLAGLLTVSELPPWVRQGAAFPAVAAALLVTLVVLVYWRGTTFLRRWVAPLLPERAAAGLERVVEAMVEGMKVLPDPLLVLAVFAVSMALWFLPILSSYIMILAFHLHLPFGAALVIFIFIGIGTALPNLPGMIGPYQYACQLALGIYGVSGVDGLAYGLVLNAVQVLTILAQGLVALPLAQVSLADLRRARDLAPQE
jgi:glycosyltransferase 2 family protein